MSDLEQRLREAMDGVTPGPWVAEQSMSRKYLDAVLFQYQSGIKGTVALIGKEAAQVGASELDEQNANSAYIALCSPNNISALLDTIASLRSKLEEAEGAQPKNIEKTADQLAASLGVLLRDWLTGPKPLEGDGLEHVIKLRIHRLLTEAALASLREADHA